ncbi:MAG: hypothetical protein CMJ83_16510 [Planctomycetes bacterium]|nr:hypothetical protein [Planctomycetota bacterium]
MSGNRDRAGALLEEARAFLEAGRARKAISVAGKGLDALGEGDARDREHLALIQALADVLRSATEAANKPAAFSKRLPALFQAGLRRGPHAADYIKGLALEEKRTDDEALEVYTAYLAAGGTLADDLRVRLNQILSYALHIRLTTPLETARALVPRLQELHAIRPKLTFPRLYLGRFHYLERRFDEARELLCGIQGRLATSPKVLNIRARCAEKLGLAEEAIEVYRTSLVQDNHQPHVHFRVGRLLLDGYRRAIGLDSSLQTDAGAQAP